MRLVLFAVLALASCKPRSGFQIGEDCVDDKECADGLYCTAGLGKSTKCLKSCGPTKLEAHQNDQVDTTCPKGWSCSATLVSTYKDKNGREQSAFMGLQDRAVCVPDGWKPEP